MRYTYNGTVTEMIFLNDLGGDEHGHDKTGSGADVRVMSTIIKFYDINMFANTK